MGVDTGDDMDGDTGGDTGGDTSDGHNDNHKRQTEKAGVKMTETQIAVKDDQNQGHS